MTKAAPKLVLATGAAFWENDRTQAAEKLLDIWATQVHHMHAIGLPGGRVLGPGRGLITLDSIFELREVEYKHVKAGFDWVEKDHKATEKIVKTLDLPMLSLLFVSRVLASLAVSGMEKVTLPEQLLLHLYPRTGPYTRLKTYDYEGFEAPGLVCGLQGAFLRRSTIAFLRQIHRELICEISQAGRDPKRLEGRR